MYLSFRKTGETVPEGTRFAGYPVLELEGVYRDLAAAAPRHWDDSYGVPTLHVEEYDDASVPGCVVVVGELARYVVRTTLDAIDEAIDACRREAGGRDE